MTPADRHRASALTFLGGGAVALSGSTLALLTHQPMHLAAAPAIASVALCAVALVELALGRRAERRQDGLER